MSRLTFRSITAVFLSFIFGSLSAKRQSETSGREPHPAMSTPVYMSKATRQMLGVANLQGIAYLLSQISRLDYFRMTRLTVRTDSEPVYLPSVPWGSNFSPRLNEHVEPFGASRANM